MKATFNHVKFSVLDLEKTIQFYQQALGLQVSSRFDAPDGSFTNLYMSDASAGFRLELTWNNGREEPYDLGEESFHLAFAVEDMDASHKLHEEMGVICFENPMMGIYFVKDPDGYWIEIVPA